MISSFIVTSIDRLRGLFLCPKKEVNDMSELINETNLEEAIDELEGGLADDGKGDE